jgi:hypothetical protein
MKLVGLLVLALGLSACHYQFYTVEDRTADTVIESAAEKLYVHNQGDGGDPENRALSRSILCAAQRNLATHDAGRLVGAVDCVENRR